MCIIMKVICDGCSKEFEWGCQKCPWCGKDHILKPSENIKEPKTGWCMINGIGTKLSGIKYLSREWSSNLDIYFPDVRSIYPIECRYIIGTTSFAVLFIPLIPIETAVYLEIPHKSVFLNEYSYLKIYSPCGDNKICWEHVKSSIGFYIWPMLILICIAWSIGKWIGGM